MSAVDRLASRCRFLLVLCKDGSVECWGANNVGQAMPPGRVGRPKQFQGRTHLRGEAVRGPSLAGEECQSLCNLVEAGRRFRRVSAPRIHRSILPLIAIVESEKKPW